MDFLNKYQRSEDTALCMAGIVLLCVDLCKSDGDFSQRQHDDILDILTKTPSERKFISEIISEASNDTRHYKDHAIELYDLLHEHKDFLELIMASLYRLAMVDKVLHDSEKQLLFDVFNIFQLKPSLNFKIKNLIKLR